MQHLYFRPFFILAYSPSDIDLSELESFSRIAGGELRENVLEVNTGRRPDSIEADQPGHLNTLAVSSLSSVQDSRLGNTESQTMLIAID